MNESNDIERKANQGLNDFERKGGDIDKVKGELNSRLDSLFDEPPAKIKKNGAVIAFFVLIILTLVILGIYMFNESSKENEESTIYFVEFFEPLPTTYISRGNDADNLTNDQTVRSGMQAYENGEYNKAIELLSKENLTEDSKLYLYISYLAIGEGTKSTSGLEELAKSQNYKYQDAALWYLALAYVQAGDEVNAIFVLEEIQEYPNHYKKGQAADLANQLKN